MNFLKYFYLINKTNTQNIEKEQLAAKQNEIRYKMLATQINPHFLFNTLETIRMKSLASGEKEVAMMDKFRNDYIIHFYGAVFIPNKICMVTEFAQYGSIQDLINKENFHEPSKTIKITISSSPAKNKALTGVGVGFAPQNRESNAKLNIVGDYADYMSNQNISTSNIDSSKIGTKIVVDAAFSRDANDFYVGERGANFTGYLLDEDGKPVVNRTVQVAVNGPVYNLTTDENGLVTVNNLPWASYYFKEKTQIIAIFFEIHLQSIAIHCNFAHIKF